MKSTAVVSVLILVMLGGSPAAWAQADADTTSIWRIVTQDDNEFFGTILEETDSYIRLQTENLGVLTIQRADILRMERVEEERIRDGEVWPEHLQSTRHFWSPNGHGLKKGEGYYQNVWIFFHQFNVGLIDQFSIGGGLIPAFLLGGTDTPIWITPQISVPLDGKEGKINLGIGLLAGTILGTDVDGEATYGNLFGRLTFGTRDKNATVGLGYGFAAGEWANVPALTFGMVQRTGRRAYFVTENYMLDLGEETLGLIGLGGRFVGQRISLDYGGFIPVVSELDRPIIFPWLGIMVPFNNRK